MGSVIETEVMVIGAGFAGLSTAYHLAQSTSKRILVLEKEEKVGSHASGRNAGMIRQAIADPWVARLAHEGREALSRLPKKRWKGVGFRTSGSLLLAKGKKIGELRQIAKTLRREKVRCQWFSKTEAAARVELLQGGDFERGLFCPSDARVEVEALLAAFLRELGHRGVQVFFNHPLEAIERTKDGFIVFSGNKIFLAKKIVNAGGAWAGLVGLRAGATKIPFKAYRRHIFFSHPFPSLKKSWPFVWDLSHNFYFRPIGEALLLSPCDKVLFNLSLEGPKANVEPTDPGMRKVLVKKLDHFSDRFGFLKIKSQKSGLRTMTPDGRFVIGEDPKVKGFFWVAGLGGHGVTTAFAVGRMASNIILGKRVNGNLKKVFSPSRFSK